MSTEMYFTKPSISENARNKFVLKMILKSKRMFKKNREREKGIKK